MNLVQACIKYSYHKRGVIGRGDGALDMCDSIFGIWDNLIGM